MNRRRANCALLTLEPPSSRFSRRHRNSRAADAAVRRGRAAQTSHDLSADPLDNLLADLFASPLAAARPAVAPHLRCRIQTRRDRLSRDWACSVAGTPRCGSRLESCHRKAATRQAYTPPAVPRFRDIPQLRRPVRRRSPARDQEWFDAGCNAFACPLPFRLRVNGRGPPRGELPRLQMNAADERFGRTRKCERRQGTAKPVPTMRVPYSTLPIFFTAAIRRALSSAMNFENSGASR